MTQRTKRPQQAATLPQDLVAAPPLTSNPSHCVHCSAGTTSSASRQPAMQRHIHPIPLSDNNDHRHPSQQAALLRALEQQNALLTDLLSAVNGLTALICSRSSS